MCIREEAASMRHCGSEPTNTSRTTLALFLVLGGCTTTPLFAQQNVVQHKAIPVSTRTFSLQEEGERFFLQELLPTPEHPRIAIPREWLIPPHETEDDEDTAPVSPFKYDRRVTSFPIGNGEIGLRFSSFDAMTEGSMALAEGKDVFLIYDPSAGKLRPGGFDLGITKERDWGSGCFSAHMVHLLVADTNEDGLTDIGAVKEEVWCPETIEDELEETSQAKPVENKRVPPELENIVERHLYQQHLVTWYVYTPDGWKLDSRQAGFPNSYAELPLTGIVMSPVDFVGALLWQSFDPKSWVDRPLYVPTYRKKLIAGGPSDRKNSRHSRKLENGQCR
jgi:hypothetical protein